MYVIIGLGNPEQEYGNTRHNMGFNTINKLAKQYNIDIDKNKFKGIYGTGIIEDEKIILLKPQTYMNLSGESVKEILNFYKTELDNVIIIYDDIDIETGIVKIRKSGGAGTHNGMKSIIQSIGNKNFIRIRIGIGIPEDKSRLVEHVIGPISDEDKEKLEIATSRAKDSIIEIIKNGVDVAMNKFN